MYENNSRNSYCKQKSWKESFRHTINFKYNSNIIRYTRNTYINISIQELLDNQFKIYYNEELNRINKYSCRSQHPRGLRCRSAAARLLRLWVRIPQVECLFLHCKCCVLSGRGLCDELINHPEESYRLSLCVI